MKERSDRSINIIMAEKKHSSFALLRILEEETDEEHILTANQLMSRLAEQYDLHVERRTLYSNIEILRQAGYEISDYYDNGKGYYLLSRQFDKSEILLLCNAIHASHFIAEKQSNDLIQKLLATLSREQRREFKDAVYMPNRLKTENNSLFYTIGIISEAIRDGRSVRFTYLHYNAQKKLVPRREEPYTVEPRYIVYNDSRPYLICTNPKYTDFVHYRLDKIKDPEILNEPVRKLTKVRETEAYRYAENKLFMFAGDTDWVTFRCAERIMDQMIDIFGPQLRTSPAENGYFTCRVKTTESGALFLAQQFMDAIQITAPESLRTTFVENLRNTLLSY